MRSVFASIGGQDGGTSELAIMHVSMRPYGERTVTTEYVVERIREFGATLADVELSAAVQDPFGLGDAGGAPVAVKLKGEDPDELRELADVVAAVVAEVPGTRDVSSSMRAGRPEVQVIVDRDRAASYGLVGVSDRVVAAHGGGRRRGDAVSSRRNRARKSTSRCSWRKSGGGTWPPWSGCWWPTPTGVSVPLYEVASIVEGVAPVSIDREDQARVATVSAHIVGPRPEQRRRRTSRSAWKPSRCRPT